MTKAMENKKKYLKSPDVGMIEAFIKELGVTEQQFERFYGIPQRTIIQMRYDGRGLPAKFWHIIYEKVKPAYGVGFLEPVQTKSFFKTIKRLKESISNVQVTKNITSDLEDIDIKGRLADLL